MNHEFTYPISTHGKQECIVIKNFGTRIAAAGFDSQQYDRDPLAVVLGVIFVTSILVTSMYFTIKKSVKKNINDLKERSETISSNKDEAYEKVAYEIERGEIIKPLWAKAFEKANGNDSKAKAFYIKYRVKQLLSEIG